MREFTTFEFMEINDCMHGCYRIAFIWSNFKIDHVMIPFYQFDCKCCKFLGIVFMSSSVAGNGNIDFLDELNGEERRDKT